MRDEEERSKQGHTNNKAKQHSTPKAVTFPKEKLAASGGTQTHDTLHSRQSALPAELSSMYMYMSVARTPGNVILCNVVI